MHRLHLLLLGLAVVVVPNLASAAVMVAEPTGDADPAFLAELKASLEAVAAEAAPDLDAEMRSSAVTADAEIDLVVELAPRDGEPTREARTASTASALAQARAMARSAIAALAAAKTETTAAGSPEVTTSVSPAAHPPLPVKYDRRKALLMTALPTFLLPVVGGAFVGLAFAADGENAAAACLQIGVGLASIGLLAGPAPGYFYIGKRKHAVAMLGVRLSLVGLAAVFAAVSLASSRRAEFENEACEGTGEEEAGGCDHHGSNIGLVVGIISGTLLAVVAFSDAALVGLAADRANADWREKRKVEIQAAPIVWSDGNGNGTFGLAVSGRF